MFFLNFESLDELKEYYIESTIKQLSKTKHPQLDKYVTLRKKEGKQGSFFVDVYYENNTFIFKWLVEPTYEGQADHEPQPPEEVGIDGKPFKDTNSYEVDIEFKNWQKYFDTNTMNEGKPTLKEMRDMIRSDDVLVHCSCPGYHWLGIKYQSGDKTALNPTNIANPDWKARNKKNYGVASSPKICKHLKEVLPTVPFNTGSMLNKFRSQIDKLLDDGYQFYPKVGFIK